MATPRRTSKTDSPSADRARPSRPAIAKAICDNLELAIRSISRRRPRGSAARQSAQHADEGVTAVFSPCVYRRALTAADVNPSASSSFAIRGQARIRRDNRFRETEHPRVGRNPAGECRFALHPSGSSIGLIYPHEHLSI